MLRILLIVLAVIATGGLWIFLAPTLITLPFALMLGIPVLAILALFFFLKLIFWGVLLGIFFLLFSGGFYFFH